MSSITIHNLDGQLDQVIREKAREEGRSLNQTIKRILRESVGLERRRKQGKADFSNLVGTMSKAEGKRLMKRIEGSSERVDPHDWE